jgi:hypothetical protein
MGKIIIALLAVELFLHSVMFSTFAARLMLGFTDYIHQPPLYSATWGQMGPEKSTKCQ